MLILCYMSVVIIRGKRQREDRETERDTERATQRETKAKTETNRHTDTQVGREKG